MYKILYSKKALNDLSKLRKNEPKCYAKAQKLIEELIVHPTKGTGHPEQLLGEINTWSRHINKKHRLIYEIFEDIISINLLSSYGHYDDR